MCEVKKERERERSAAHLPDASATSASMKGNDSGGPERAAANGGLSKEGYNGQLTKPTRYRTQNTKEGKLHTVACSTRQPCARRATLRTKRPKLWRPAPWLSNTTRDTVDRALWLLTNTTHPKAGCSRSYSSVSRTTHITHGTTNHERGERNVVRDKKTRKMYTQM